jgi:F-type H+-transporting ATPase subunit delta
MPDPGAENAAYARALVALGRATDAAQRFEQEVGLIQDLLQQNPSIREFMHTPLVAAEGKEKALEELLRGRVHPVLLKFLLTLVAAGAWSRFDDIAAGFFELGSRERQETAAELVTAMPLPDPRVAEIERAVGAYLGQPVRCHVRVDTRLIGGVRVKVGNALLDGSVQSRLERIREALTP